MTDTADIRGLVGELTATVKHLDGSVRSLAERVEKMRGANWSAIGVLAAIAIPTVGGLTWGFVTRMEATEQQVQRQGDRLERLIQLETERNNRIEREMGGVQMLIDLYRAGMLRSAEGAKP